MHKGCVLVLKADLCPAVKTLLRKMDFHIMGGEDFPLVLDVWNYPPLRQLVTTRDTAFTRKLKEHGGKRAQCIGVRYWRPMETVLEEHRDLLVPETRVKFGDAALYPTYREARAARNVFLRMRELFVPVRTFPDPFADYGHPVSVDYPHMRG